MHNPYLLQTSETKPTSVEMSDNKLTCEENGPEHHGLEVLKEMRFHNLMCSIEK